jgi:hypothetical protein
MSVADSSLKTKYKRVLVILPYNEYWIQKDVTLLKERMEEQLSAKGLLVDNLSEAFDNTIKLNANSEFAEKIALTVKRNNDDLILHFNLIAFRPGSTLSYEIIATDCATKKEVWKAEDVTMGLLSHEKLNSLNAKRIVLKLQTDGILK